MAGAQTRALQSRSGAGIWIDILPNQMGSNWAAIDLAVANVADPYAGDTTTSKITSLSSGVASTVTATFSDTCLPPTSSSYLIRFQGSQTWFKFDPTTTQISLRPELGQTTANTVWPTPPASYEVVGCPTKDASTALTLGNGVAIDLTNSFVGTTPILPLLPRTFTSKLRLMVVYDTGAKPAYMICDDAATREPLREPIFLLVADIESIQNGTSLTKPGGFWVAIDPRGGIPRVGEVNTAGATVIQKQSVVRQGLMQFGR
jgi:hypothetical protein